MTKVIECLESAAGKAVSQQVSAQLASLYQPYPADGRVYPRLNSAAGEAVTKTVASQVASLYRMEPSGDGPRHRMVKAGEGMIRFEKV